jgi:polyferredoxin/tetratricopeptide (TPR) repeat protein
MFWAKHRRIILLLIYAAFFGHAAIWYSLGYQGVGHLGFGEFFATMRTGLVTAGTIFTLLMFLHGLFFGGLFCGWFCHWGITQDLSSWILKKIGIKHPMISFNSRLIPWLWFFVLIGQVVFFWLYNGLPTSLSMELGATPVWAGVPRSIFMICITLVVSCFFMVMLFGERAFCRSVCTFRLWFSWFEKLSFHKLRQTKPCSACQDECTTICPMGLEVAKEIKTLGHIKNQECIKCYNCVKACPNGVIASSFRKTGHEKPGPQIVRPSFLHPSILWLQLAMAAIILVLFCGKIGGNMSLSIGFVLGYFIIQVYTTRRLSLISTSLCLALPVLYYYSTDLNDLTSTIKGLALLMIFIFLSKLLGVEPERSFAQEKALNTRVPKPLLAIAFGLALWLGGSEIFYSLQISKATAAQGANNLELYTELMEKYGHAHTKPVLLHFSLAEAYSQLKNPKKALEHYEKSLNLDYKLEAAEAALNSLVYQGSFKEAQALALTLEQKHPEDSAHFQVAYAYTKLYLGEKDEAITILGKAVSQIEVPTSVIQTLAELRLEKNQLEETKELLKKHVQRDPSNLAPMLAAIYATQGANAKAKALLEENLEAYWNSLHIPLATLYAQDNELEKTEKMYREALAKNSKDYESAYYLGLSLANSSRLVEAIQAWQLIPKEFEAYEAAQDNINTAKMMLNR